LHQSAQPSVSQDNIIQTTSEHLEDHIHEDVIEDHLLDTIVDELSIEAIASNVFSPMTEAGLARESEAFHNVEGPSNSAFDEVTGFGNGSSGFDPVANGADEFRAEIQGAKGIAAKVYLGPGLPERFGPPSDVCHTREQTDDEKGKTKGTVFEDSKVEIYEEGEMKEEENDSSKDTNSKDTNSKDTNSKDTSAETGRPSINDIDSGGTLDPVTFNEAFNELKGLGNPSGMPTPFGNESNDMPDIVTDFNPDSLIDPSSNLGEDGYTKGWDNFKAPDFTPDVIEDPSVNWGSHFNAAAISSFDATIAGPKGTIGSQDTQASTTLTFVSIEDQF